MPVAAGFGDETPSPSRRDRLRAATKDEIIATARRLLVREGPESVTLRAIAREMGMTAPGLYRYYASHEELIRHVVAGIFTELAADVDAAIHAAGETSPREHSLEEAHKDPRHITAEMAAACHGFRQWALTHTAEFSLLFGVPLPGMNDGRWDIADECALQFAGVYFTLFLKLWDAHPFPVPAPADIDPGLRKQLERYMSAVGATVPVGAMLTFLRCWTLLYGAVSMEVFGHLHFALEDPGAMFEITLGDIAALVGLVYPISA
ncbi:MAG TPA: TetR/AcrR family transcriptional regulator [Streptosporangiaceae bacterium]